MKICALMTYQLRRGTATVGTGGGDGGCRSLMTLDDSERFKQFDLDDVICEHSLAHLWQRLAPLYTTTATVGAVFKGSAGQLLDIPECGHAWLGSAGRACSRLIINT